MRSKSGINMDKAIDYALEAASSEGRSRAEWSELSKDSFISRTLKIAQAQLRKLNGRELSMGEYSGLESRVYREAAGRYHRLQRPVVSSEVAKHSAKWWLNFWRETGEILLPTQRSRRSYPIKHISPDHVVTLADDRAFRVLFTDSRSRSGETMPLLVLPDNDIQQAHWVLPEQVKNSPKI